MCNAKVKTLTVCSKIKDIYYNIAPVTSEVVPDADVYC